MWPLGTRNALLGHETQRGISSAATRKGREVHEITGGVKTRMTVHKPTRFHRIAYLVLWLMVAVVLTTALVMAAGQGASAPQSTNSRTSASELSLEVMQC